MSLDNQKKKNLEVETWKEINLTIFLEFPIVNFFTRLCLNSLAWFFFISIQSFIIPFIQVSSSLLIVQSGLSSTHSCFLKCLFCFQSFYSTPHHSWKACSHSPLDDAATDNHRVKIIHLITLLWACKFDAMSMRIQPSPPKERGMKKRTWNKCYFLSQQSLRIYLKTDDNFPVADCVGNPPKNGTNKKCFLQNAKRYMTMWFKWSGC